MVSVTEKTILDPAALLLCGWHYPGLRGWRQYHIEYGISECGCPAVTIFLPPNADPQQVEDLLNKIMEAEQ